MSKEAEIMDKLDKEELDQVAGGNRKDSDDKPKGKGLSNVVYKSQGTEQHNPFQTGGANISDNTRHTINSNASDADTALRATNGSKKSRSW